VKEYLPGGDELLARAGSSLIELSDLAGEIEKLGNTIDAEPQRLTLINERLDIIYSLIQKHRVGSLSELINKKEEIKQIVMSIVTGDERLNELESVLEEEKAKLTSLSGEISEKRRNVLPDVESRVTDLLKQLGMPNGKFRITLVKLDDFTPSGTDHADFLFSANRQVEPENLAKTASGGELSRVMLSLKSLLTMKINLPTIIFDEIDAGVSGEVADRVGQILSGMGKYMQVVNITHLPQVASRGDRHYHVYKDDEGDSTITRVKLLTHEQRIMEVARLLSGKEITDTAIRNAKELLKSARN